MGQGGCSHVRSAVGHAGTLRNTYRLALFALALVVLLLTVPQANASGTGHIHGTVRDANGNGLGGIIIAVNQYVDGQWKSSPGWEWSSADGSYDWSLLTPGTYRVQFIDEAGAYASTFYPDVAFFDMASSLTVANDQVSYASATMYPAAHITGTVRTPSGSPVSNAEVWALALRNGSWVTVVGGIRTDSSGRYDIGRLSAGAYRVKCNSWLPDYVEQFYPWADRVEDGTDVYVGGAGVANGIDMALGALPTPTLVANPFKGGYTNSQRVLFSWSGVQNPVAMRFGINGTWSSWRSFQTNDSYDIPEGDGLKTVYGQYRNVYGAVGTTQAEVVLDTVGPQCYARSTSVVKGRRCTLRGEVRELLSDKVRPVMVIRTLGSSIKQSWAFDLKTPYPYTSFSRSFRCMLRRGVYRIEVRAYDHAGNEQTRVGRARLTVK